MMAAPLVAPAPFEARPGLSRRHLLLAWTYDLVTLLAATAGGSVLAIAWMLARTDRGRFDLAVGDAVIALALTAAAGPAWTAWQWLRLSDEGVTFGHARFAASEISARPSAQRGRRRALVLALHPVSLPLWVWLTAACFASGAGALIALAIIPLAVTLLVGLLMMGSLALLLIRPAALPLHMWIARATFGVRR